LGATAWLTRDAVLQDGDGDAAEFASGEKCVLRCLGVGGAERRQSDVRGGYRTVAGLGGPVSAPALGSHERGRGSLACAGDPDRAGRLREVFYDSAVGVHSPAGPRSGDERCCVSGRGTTTARGVAIWVQLDFAGAAWKVGQDRPAKALRPPAECSGGPRRR